jgi:phosphate/phosphite/phosphonate ABC transporter binding protein
MTLHRPALLLPLILLVSSAACGLRDPGRDVQDIDFSRTTDSSYRAIEDSTRLPIRVAIAAMTSPRRTLDYYEEMLSDLSRYLDRPLRIEQRKTYAEVNRLIIDDQIDLAFVCSGAYVSLREELPVDILAVPVIGGETVYRAYIIAGKRVDADRFEDLYGKTFAFTDLLSNTGYTYAATRVAELGKTPSEFFREAVFTHGHDTSIQAVNRGTVEAATVDGLIFDYLAQTDPESIRNVKIIEKSTEFGIPPLIVRSDMDPKLKSILQDYFLFLSETPGGHALLRPLMIDRFVEGNERAYDNIPKRDPILSSK